MFDIIDPVTRDPLTKIQKNHPIRNIIGRRTRDKQSLKYQDMGYKKEIVDKTLFIKFFKTCISIIKIDVNNIVFGFIALSIAEAEFVAARSYCT